MWVHHDQNFGNGRPDNLQKNFLYSKSKLLWQTTLSSSFQPFQNLSLKYAGNLFITREWTFWPADFHVGISEHHILVWCVLQTVFRHERHRYAGSCGFCYWYKATGRRTSQHCVMTVTMLQVSWSKPRFIVIPNFRVFLWFAGQTKESLNRVHMHKLPRTHLQTKLMNYQSYDAIEWPGCGTRAILEQSMPPVHRLRHKRCA